MRKHYSRDAFIFASLLFFCALFARGQAFGPFSITGTGCTKSVDLAQKGTVTYQVTGSWTGTIQPKVAIAGQAAINKTATPANSTTPLSTITANGAYFTSISGYSVFQLCGATVTGTAVIYVNVSTAPR